MQTHDNGPHHAASHLQQDDLRTVLEGVCTGIAYLQHGKTQEAVEKMGLAISYTRAIQLSAKCAVESAKDESNREHFQQLLNFSAAVVNVLDAALLHARQGRQWLALPMLLPAADIAAIMVNLAIEQERRLRALH